MPNFEQSIDQATSTSDPGEATLVPKQDTVQHQSNGHGTPLDRAWEIVDAIQPGQLPLDVRTQLAYAFADEIIRHQRELRALLCGFLEELDNG